MRVAKSLFLKAVYKSATARYHIIQRTRARSVLRCIEASKGKTNPKFIKMAEAYSKEVLGWSGYSPWLHVYSAISGSFKEGWIPDNYYGSIVVPALQGDYGKISNLKLLSNKLLNTELFPDIMYFANGLWLTSSMEVVNGDSVVDVLFDKLEMVVFKQDSSLQGKGIHFFERSNFSVSEIKKLGNGTFQGYIKQHEFFDEFMPTSLTTIRITTVTENSGKVSARAAYLRIGRSFDTHVRSASNIRVPIDLDKGELFGEGFQNNWLSIDSHPDTKTTFANRKIPNFQSCLTTAINLHKTIPFVRSIGWDMIVDRNDQVKLMEWNGLHNDIKFTEATTGPCFADLGWENLWRKK